MPSQHSLQLPAGSVMDAQQQTFPMTPCLQERSVSSLDERPPQAPPAECLDHTSQAASENSDKLKDVLSADARAVILKWWRRFGGRSLKVQRPETNVDSNRRDELMKESLAEWQRLKEQLSEQDRLAALRDEEETLAFKIERSARREASAAEIVALNLSSALHNVGVTSCERKNHLQCWLKLCIDCCPDCEKQGLFAACLL